MSQAPLLSTWVNEDGLTAIALNSGRIEVSIFPEAGAKVYDLIDTQTGFNVLWHNPRVPLAATRVGAPFDDSWAGGWDDLFPTDVACGHGDNTFPDHGDLWTGKWSWEALETGPDIATIHLWCLSVCLPCRVDKWITVRADSPELVVELQLANVGPHGFHYMFNQHIAHAIGAGSRLHIPTRRLAVEPGSRSRIGDSPHLQWPQHPGLGDVSTLPATDAELTEFLYAEDLQAGWAVVTHPTEGLATRLEFDDNVFATPWFWGVYGGWRGHRLLLTEPCTSRPGSLSEAIANGSAAYLDSGGELRTTVKVEVVHDFDPTAPGDVDPTSVTR